MIRYFLAGLVVGVVGSFAHEVHATYRGYSAIRCVPSVSAVQVVSDGSNGFGYFNTGASGNIIYCPILDDESGAKHYANTTSVTVHVLDENSSGNVAVYACAATVSASSTTCGAATYSSGIGAQALSPSLSAWSTVSNGYPAIWVVIPAVSSGLKSGVFGYRQTF